MKTPQEIKFQDLIIKQIEYKCSDFNERYALLRDFCRNKQDYYDEFCDYVYKCATSDFYEIVSIDECGVPHIHSKEGTDENFIVLTKQDFNRSCEDIIVYIDLALGRLQEAINI